LAKKIILQAVVCLIIVFVMIWLKNIVEELPQTIVTEVRLRVVERNVTPNDIYNFFTDTYKECLEYIHGTE
jgi:hypothetical protein